MFTIGNGKTTLPKPMTTGDITTAKPLQEKAEQLLLEIGELLYKHWKSQLDIDKIKESKIKDAFSQTIKDYKDDNTSKINFLLFVCMMNDAEGTWYDLLIAPFVYEDADKVIVGCNDIINKLSPQRDKLKSLVSADNK